MMNVLGLIASRRDPASRFRIIQYAPYLKQLDISLTHQYYIPTKDSSPAAWTKGFQRLTTINPWRTWNVLQNISRLPLLAQQYQYDIIWQSRMLLPYLIKADKLINKPVVFDLDDAIWVFENVREIGRAIASAAEVFAGNEYLAQWAGKYNGKVTLVPTTVDVWHFIPKQQPSSPFTIGWIGTASNLNYLHLVKDTIVSFVSTYSDARFVVVSNAVPDFINFDNEKFIFKQWEAKKEVDWINEFTVGIMPLPDDEWTRGKCGAKLLQYMACAKPVIASPVGLNNSLLAHDVGVAARNESEWTWAFEKLYHEPETCKTLGCNGRALVEEAYSTEGWAPLIAERFRLLKH